MPISKNRMTIDATPRTLYVSRKVKNAKDIVDWAKSQGFNDILPAGEMHVTIAYSRKPIDWMKIQESWASEITVPSGGPRVIEEFGGGAKVLQFRSSELEWRHKSIIDAGASWDWPEYSPHITISYGDMPDNVSPYSGDIVLGPEIFAEVDEDWKANLIVSEIGDKMQTMIKFRDTADIGKTKKTQEGYLVATSRVARTGVQTYLASELGDVADGFEPDAVVRVYRAEDQVFHKDTLASITRVPVTLGHPPEMVDADNWATYSVGDVGDAFARDGEWIVVNPMIKDAAARTAAETTHKEISMGYTANIVKARDGVDADFEMIDIRMNHLALVPKGRAGSQARIGDAQLWGASPVTVEDNTMTVELKTVILGDKAVQVEAKDADTVAAILKDHKAAIDAKDETIGELKAKLKDAEDKVATFDAAVDAAVAARDMREKVKAAFGDEAIKGASDAEIAGMFKVIDKAVNDSARDAIKNKQTKVDDAWGDIIAKLPTYKKESK